MDRITAFARTVTRIERVDLTLGPGVAEELVRELGGNREVEPGSASEQLFQALKRELDLAKRVTQ